MKTTALGLTGVLLAAAAITGCGSAELPAAGALPGDAVVFTVMSGGGMVPPVLYAMQSPSLVLYGDGRVLTAATTPARDLIPARYLLARIDPATVAGFVESARSSGLLGGGTDFGIPRATDLDTTTVMLRGDDGPSETAVYALNERFETDLTASQRDARNRLRTLIDRGAALAAGAVSQPWTPERVAVYEPMSRAFDDPPDATWPGPAPESFMTPTRSRRSTACGQLTGAQAGAVYLAALENPGARWLVGGAARVLAVNPFPPDPACVS